MDVRPSFGPESSPLRACPAYQSRHSIRFTSAIVRPLPVGSKNGDSLPLRLADAGCCFGWAAGWRLAGSFGHFALRRPARRRGEAPPFHEAVYFGLPVKAATAVIQPALVQPAVPDFVGDRPHDLGGGHIHESFRKEDNPDLNKTILHVVRGEGELEALGPLAVAADEDDVDLGQEPDRKSTR